jgi:hypothetical protein
MRGARQVNQLEAVSVEVLLDYLSKTTPGKVLVEKARVAQATFASIQRRRSAENQREALRFMMRREHLAPTLPMLPTLPELSSGVSSSSSSATTAT